MRKYFLAITILLFAASIYTYWTMPANQQKRIILHWKTDANPQRHEQIALFHEWLKEHGHVNEDGDPIIDLRLDTASNQSVLIQAFSGVGGDIIDIRDAQMFSLGFLDPLSDFSVKGYDFSLKSTYPHAKYMLEYKGKQYAYPCNVGVCGLWVNKDRFKELGMSLPPEAWDMDLFEKIGKEFIKRANANIESSETRSFFCENPVSSGVIGQRMIHVMQRGMGLDDFNETYTASALNDPRFIKLIKRLKKWTIEDHLFPSSSESASMNSESGYGGGKISLFGKGKYALLNVGRWGLIRLRQFKNPPNLALVRYPAESFPNMLMTGRLAAIYKGSKNKKYAKLFFAFLSDKKYNDYIAEHSDGLPPNPRFADNNKLIFAPQKYPNEGDSSAYELKWAESIAFPAPNSPYINSGELYKTYGIDKYMNDLCDAEEAAALIAKKVNMEIELTINESEKLREAYERDCKTQKIIDELKKKGKKIPARLIKNPFYLKYYESKGMLEATENNNVK